MRVHNLTKDEEALIGLELYGSIKEAEQTKEQAIELDIQESLKADEDVASIEDIESYIEKRKQLLEKMGMPYNELGSITEEIDFSKIR